MLGAIRDEILDASHDVTEENGSVDQCAETGNLAGDGGPHLGLVVFQEFHECRHQIPRDDLFVHSFGDLVKRVSCHESGWIRAREGSRSARLTFSYLSAIIYRTLQLLSSIRLLSEVNRTP